MNYQITLDGKDVTLATEVGTRRNESNIRWQSKNLKVSKRPDQEIHIDGFAGEVSFVRITEHVAKDFGCEIDLEDTHSIEDTLIDNDVTVDVKTFQWDHSNLLVPAHKKDKACQIYVLMTGSLPTFTFRGWIPGTELFATEPVRKPTKILNYNIPQDQLRDPQELLNSSPAEVRFLIE